MPRRQQPGQRRWGGGAPLGPTAGTDAAATVRAAAAPGTRTVPHARAAPSLPPGPHPHASRSCAIQTSGQNREASGLRVCAANSQENPQNKKLKISFFKCVPGGPLSGALGHGTSSRCGWKVLRTARSYAAVKVLLRLKTEKCAGLLGLEGPIWTPQLMYIREGQHFTHTHTPARAPGKICL